MVTKGTLTLTQLVAALEKLLPARLRSLKPRALRAAAARLGVSAPPVTTRAQKEARVCRSYACMSAACPLHVHCMHMHCPGPRRPAR